MMCAISGIKLLRKGAGIHSTFVHSTRNYKSTEQYAMTEDFYSDLSQDLLCHEQWRSYTRAYTDLGPGELGECPGKINVES